MRNALICAGTMLALVLLWPILFGGAAASTAAANAAGGSTVTMAVPAPVVIRASQTPLASTPLAALPSVFSVAESCRVTAERARRLCTPGNRACAASVQDAYDICEARGIWPA